MKQKSVYTRVGYVVVCVCSILGLLLGGIPSVPRVAAEALIEPPNVPDAGPPTLLEPQKNLITSDHTPMFRWEEELMADYYTLEIKDRVTNAVIAKATYAASVRCSGGICSVPSPVYLPNDEYKWHVLSRQDGERMGWSVWWNLTVGSVSLATPTQTMPVDNEIIYPSRPYFAFTASSSAIEYRVRIKNEAGVFIYDHIYPVGICFGTCSGDCEFQLPIDLTSYETYRWQVQAKNGEYYSTWSSFSRIRYTQIPRTNLTSPYDGQAIYTPTMTFEWEAVADIYSYQITIRRESNDDLIYNEVIFPASCTVSLCSWTYDGPPLAVATYKWHVRGTSGANLAQWTPYWVFHWAYAP